MNELTKEKLLETLLQSYSAYFDIENNIYINDSYYDAVAKYHSRSEKYLLTKKAKLWAAETNEYVFFIKCNRFDCELFKKSSTDIIEQSLKMIQPHNEHMYTYISMIVIADEIDDAAREQFIKFNFRKNFLFSLHGWTELRIAVFNLAEKTIETNSLGKELKQNFKKTLKKFYIN